MNQHQADRVEAIAEVVRDYSDGHGNTDGFRHLECQTDPDAIHKAVSNQRKSGEHTYLRVVMRGVVGLVAMMDQHEFLKAVKQKKPDHERDHCTRGINPVRVGQFKNLGHDVKADYAQEHTGSEAKNEVQLAAELERKQPATKGRKKSRERQQYGGHRSIRH